MYVFRKFTEKKFTEKKFNFYQELVMIKNNVLGRKRIYVRGVCVGTEESIPDVKTGRAVAEARGRKTLKKLGKRDRELRGELLRELDCLLGGERGFCMADMRKLSIADLTDIKNSYNLLENRRMYEKYGKTLGNSKMQGGRISFDF